MGGAQCRCLLEDVAVGGGCVSAPGPRGLHQSGGCDSGGPGRSRASVFMWVWPGSGRSGAVRRWEKTTGLADLRRKPDFLRVSPELRGFSFSVLRQRQS